MIIGLGTIINFLAIVAGALIGTLLGDRLPNKTRDVVTDALGLMTLLVAGLSIIDITKPEFKEAVGPGMGVLIVLGSLILGGITGSYWKLEDRFENIGKKLKKSLKTRIKSKDENFVEGFVSASLLFVVGPLAILGSISDGLGKGIEQLALKSSLDFFASIAFAASLGIVSEVPGISSVIHDALKGKLNIQSFEKNVIEVNSGLHVLTGITNPKRWPELRTEGLLQVLKQASQIYPNIVCDLSAVLPETLDPNLNNLDIFRRFDHIPKVLELSSQLIFVSNANPLGLIRSSESLEALSEIYKREPLIVLNKVNSFSLGAKYESTVEAILGRWTNPEQIQRIPDRPELFAGSWLKAESVLNLGDGEIVGIFNKISNLVRNEVSKPPKSKRFLRRVS